MHTVFAHIGGDIGQGHSWRAGLSALNAKADARASGENRFTGDSRLWVADLVWKWAPDGNPRARQLKCWRRYFRRNEQGLFNSEGYAGTQKRLVRAGGVYRFVPR